MGTRATSMTPVGGRHLPAAMRRCGRSNRVDPGVPLRLVYTPGRPSQSAYITVKYTETA